MIIEDLWLLQHHLRYSQSENLLILKMATCEKSSLPQSLKVNILNFDYVAFFSWQSSRTSVQSSMGSSTDFLCSEDEGDEKTSMSPWLPSVGIKTACSSGCHGLQKKAVSTLSHTLWFWTLEEIRRHPSPIHNYLLISCFVSAVVAKANETNIAAVREGSPVWDRPWRAWLHSYPSSLVTSWMARATWESIFLTIKGRNLKIVLCSASFIQMARMNTISLSRETWPNSVSSPSSLTFSETQAHCERRWCSGWGPL